MTTALNPKVTVVTAILFAMVSLAIVFAWQGKIFFQPGLGEQIGRPTNDCGKNYTYAVELKDGNFACVGTIDAKIVQDKIEAKRNLAGPDEPGTIRGTGWLDEVLHEIASHWDR